MVVDQVLKDLGTSSDDWSSNSKLKSDVATFTVATDAGEEKVILAKPQTYMNESGQAVSLLAKFYKVEPEDVWEKGKRSSLSNGMQPKKHYWNRLVSVLAV